MKKNLNNKEKEELLKNLDDLIEPNKFLNDKKIILFFIVFLIFVFLEIINIYLSNNIYLCSKEIEKENNQYKILKIENKDLKNKIQKLLFKNAVTH